MEWKSFLSRIWNFAKSRTLSLYLLPIFIIALVVGTLLPGGSTLVFFSWWFAMLSFALFLNTLFCTLSRARSAWKRTFQTASRASSHVVRNLENRTEIICERSLGEALQVINSELSTRRYRVKQELTSQNASIIAEKGRFGIWGSTIFHFSFVLIFLGVLLSATTSVRGRVVLTEGEIFTERHQSYQQLQEAFLFRENHQNFKVRLDKLHLTYNKKNQAADCASDVTVFDGGQEVIKQRVAVNNPLSYKGFVFYQTALYGFSPLLILEDSQGRLLLDAYVSLNTVKKEKIEFKDSFSVPYTTLRVKARFYPHAELVGGKLRMKSLLLKKPALYLEVNDSKRKLFEGILSLNQSTNFNGLTLTFGDVRYWTSFLVTRDQGIPIIFAGFWVGLFGLALRFFLINKRIWVFLKEEGDKVIVSVGGSAERYKALFACEFADIVRNMKERF